MHVLVGVRGKKGLLLRISCRNVGRAFPQSGRGGKVRIGTSPRLPLASRASGNDCRACRPSVGWGRLRDRVRGRSYLQAGLGVFEHRRHRVLPGRTRALYEQMTREEGEPTSNAATSSRVLTASTFSGLGRRVRAGGMSLKARDDRGSHIGRSAAGPGRSCIYRQNGAGRSLRSRRSRRAGLREQNYTAGRCNPANTARRFGTGEVLSVLSHALLSDKAARGAGQIAACAGRPFGMRASA